MSINKQVSPSDKENFDTACPYCGVGCGVKASVENNKIIEVTGDTKHPSNFGRLCVKGSALHETLGEKERLLSPRIDGEDVSWDKAIGTVATKFHHIIEEHGPDAIAFYLSGQLLTEDYYVVNKLMKGFIGSANVDTNSRLCMASASMAHRRAFGADLVPGCYEDLEKTDVLFIVGSNAAYAHPVVYQRIVKAKEMNPQMKVIVLDPRQTATSNEADLHLALRPGSDGYYYNGLLVYLAENNGLDYEYIKQSCDGFEDALLTAQTQLPDMATVAEVCDVELSLLLESYQLFSENKKVVSMFSQGINQSSSGVDKGNAIINCHLASGKIGYEGAGPFSITGQPNAMGGREVGGLASVLAAHMYFEDEGIVERVERFWDAPNMARKQGLKAVDMFKAVEQGKVKAIWIIATNPVVSMPDAGFVKRALEKCPTVIVSECYEDTDTVKCADIVLPATTWGEKHGTVTSSERRISLQKPILTPPGLAKNDWQIVCDVAKKMGFKEKFNYEHPSEIFREHAGLSGFENTLGKEGSRFFDISALAEISQEDYDNFSPIQWPVNKKNPKGMKRLFEDGIYDTNNGRAQLVSILAQLPQKAAKNDELIMNTGRLRDQWHTMTRTGRAAKLMTHFDEPFIQIHPEDARRYNVEDKQLAKLNNLNADYLGRIQVSEQQRVGEVFVPIHWNANFSISAVASALVEPITDPMSGQPEYKHSPVRIKPFNTVWSGYLITRESIELETEYWSKVQLNSGVKYILADTQTLAQREDYFYNLYPDIDDWVVLKDDHKQTLRIAGFVDDVLQCFFFGSTDLSEQQSSRFIEEQLLQKHEGLSRFKLLAAIDSDGSNDVGAIVCSCFQVGEKTIQEVIANAECKTVDELGIKLKCGTNCGSCIPELKAMF